jgi:hypothetical protein
VPFAFGPDDRLSNRQRNQTELRRLVLFLVRHTQKEADMPRKMIKIGSQEIGLDARPDRLDLRDRVYQPPLGNLPSEYPSDAEVKKLLPAYAKAELIRNQGSEGACTGFGLAAAINYQHFVRAVAAGGTAAEAIRIASPAMLYQLARLYDEWPGEDYEGSSCRGALKGWHRHGVCSDKLWPYTTDKDGKRIFEAPKRDPKNPYDPKSNWDIDALECTLGVYYRVDVRSVVDMQAAIKQIGALYVSATVHEGWEVETSPVLNGHADLARIRAVPKPKDGGGHAFALVGYNKLGFVVQNSWGPDWGSSGFALLPYEDWVTHGDDAWAFTLGVSRQLVTASSTRGTSAPKQKTIRSPRFILPSPTGSAAAAMERPIGLVGAEDALSRRYRDLKNPRLSPLEPDEAYGHTILLDRGFPVRNDITAEKPEDAVKTAAFDEPFAWLKAQSKPKLMIYVHGGLNSESASILRTRVIAPYALANDIYPLFFSWRSGALETTSDLIEESFARFGRTFGGEARSGGWLDRITETTDRMLEPILRGPGGAMWSQMKLNATRASENKYGGANLVAKQLKELKKALPKLEIHFVGHSAGAIFIGAMLQCLVDNGLKAASVRLMAPACTAKFALDHYEPAVKNKTVAAENFHIHLLSDKNEKNDSVGPYRKSLLYLVSRSFEDTHKMPLLGMAGCFDRAAVQPGASDDVWAPVHIDEAREWLDFWNTLPSAKSNLHWLDKPNVSNGAESIRASHGCFDNDVKTMGEAIGYIVDPVKAPVVKIERLVY